MGELRFFKRYRFPYRGGVIKSGSKTAVTHDMFHVLLDFDTSYAGEIGVLAFAVAQKYNKLQLFSLPLAQLLSVIIVPGQIKAIFANKQRGKLMGQKANFLLNYRFEDHWTETLSSLRKN